MNTEGTKWAFSRQHRHVSMVLSRIVNNPSLYIEPSSECWAVLCFLKEKCPSLSKLLLENDRGDWFENQNGVLLQREVFI
jgi:hypothetical protein